ncbi:hypothetical protein [Taibaiella koreensis]|uniref:hypothetical protein n=1 Tax=Taibaiella koreensis TaxID=1268548 RepID=UPI000E59E6C6|nr:hypothetical protein [Taibaiella koreensis]
MKSQHITGALLLLAVAFSACTKNTCPAYWQYPGCHSPERERFYGLYRGTSLLDDSQQTTTQWQMQAGPEIGQLSMAPDLVLQLDEKDPRVFTIKDRSLMGNNRYIRSKGSKGFFNGSEVTMEFWADEGSSVVPGEKLIHYTFTGTRQ